MKAKSQKPKVKTETGKKGAEPQTMEELLATTGYSLRGFRRGETVKGKVVEVAGRTVSVNIGGKTEAIVSEQEWELSRDYLKALKPGDEVTGVVLVAESDSGQTILSLRRAASESKWKVFEEALGTGRILTAVGKGATRGGMLVEVEGVLGFVPVSQMSSEAEGIGGKQLEVRVIEADREQNRLVLSEKAVAEAEAVEKRKKILGVVKVGGEYEGIVTGMVPFGAFVGVKVGRGAKAQEVEGLVHISELSWEKVDDVGRVIKEGDRVKVQVIGIDEENGKLALSVKRLSPDPWQVVGAKYTADTTHRGVVTKIAPYGILVRLEKGIEGLIHASKMPSETSFAEGQEVEVFVESADLEKRRLSLGVVVKDTKGMIYK